MPTFNNYSSEGKLLQSVTEPLSESNVSRYIAEYGEEKFQLYLEIMSEFTNELSSILRPADRRRPGQETPHMVRTNLKSYVADKQSLINTHLKKS